LDDGEGLVHRDLLPRLDREFGHGAVERGGDGVFHLHGLDDEHRLT
jgi:hypothetical protein